MLVLALLLGSSSLDHVVQSLLTRIVRPSVAERLQSTCSTLCNCLEEKKRMAPFGVNEKPSIITGCPGPRTGSAT